MPQDNDQIYSHMGFGYHVGTRIVHYVSRRFVFREPGIPRLMKKAGGKHHAIN
jgi:hypothetical protein